MGGGVRGGGRPRGLGGFTNDSLAVNVAQSDRVDSPSAGAFSGGVVGIMTAVT